MSDDTIRILVELWPLWVATLTPLWGGWLTLIILLLKMSGKMDTNHTQLMANHTQLMERLEFIGEKICRYIAERFPLPHEDRKKTQSGGH